MGQFFWRPTDHMGMNEKTLTALQAKKAAIIAKAAAIDAEIRRREARDVAQERKRDTRRKLLLGAVTWARVDKGKISKEGVMRILDEDLVRPADRALFGLSPKPTANSAQGAPQAPSESAAEYPSAARAELVSEEQGA